MEYRNEIARMKANADEFRYKIKEMSTYELLQLKTSLYHQLELEGIHYELNALRHEQRKTGNTSATLVIPFEQRQFIDIWQTAIDEELSSRNIYTTNVSSSDFTITEEDIENEDI